MFGNLAKYYIFLWFFPDPFPNLIKVIDWSGNTTQFKIKTATALKNLMSRYCERNALEVQVFKKLCLLKSYLSPECPVHI